MVTGTGNESKVGPLSLNFGSVPVGESSTKQATIANIGAVELLISSIHIFGHDGLDFSESHDCNFGHVEPGKACKVTITFTPKGTGTRTARLRVTDNGTGTLGFLQYVILVGTGTQ